MRRPSNRACASEALSPTRQSPAPRSPGYTLIEVMTAVVVMTIGATGILAMQAAGVRSNQDANETAIAVNFGTTWIERIKRDARLWTVTGSTSLGGTKYLSSLTTTNLLNTTPGVYFVPASDANESAGADHFGFDSLVEANIRYCVNVNLTIVHAYNPATPGAPNIPTDANAIRADVRVWWHRRSEDAVRGNPACLTAALNGDQVAANRLRKHYLSTVVSWRTPGWP